MRSLKPLCLTAAVALALAGASAMAATTAARLSGAGTTTSTTAGTTSTTGTTSTSGTTKTGTVAGGCAGSNGSTCTATTSADTSASGTNSTGSTLTTSTNTPPGVFGGSSTSTSTAPTPASGDTVPPVRSAQGTNSVNVDPTLSRPGAFDPGGAFGPAAVPATASTGTIEGGIVLPTTGATTGSQQNVFVQPSATTSGTTVMNTPIFDQAARNGQAREARRRAAGDEPRVIGIAPRTDRDLSWQMPDDPIIRY